MFDDMIEEIKVDTVRWILFARPAQAVSRKSVAEQRNPNLMNVGGEGNKPVVKRISDKIGRNDPCPCGSGKKYKKCCGMTAND